MQPELIKKILLGIFILIIIGFLALILIPAKEVAEVEEPIVVPVEEPEVVREWHSVIGNSVEGREIYAHTYGTGENHVLFVGGIHGGYEWNSVLLAEKFDAYLRENLETLPTDTKVTVITSLNPDGIVAVAGKENFVAADITGDASVGRFNANGIDLNRNFDCKWKSESTWRGKTVSAGTAAFSEPEAAALQQFIAENNPKAVVFWHSQGGAVYGSECENGILPETVTVLNTYAAAAGYQAIELFDAYPISGDAEGWLASIGIPAITVELSTHEVIEWEKNLAGAKALLSLYSK